MYIATTSPPAPQNQVNDAPVIVGVGALILAVMSFLSAWAFHQIVDNWREDHVELKAQLDKVVSNQETFVRRDDYVRGMESIDKKLDILAARQDQQTQRQDGQFQILLNRLSLSRIVDPHD